MAEKKESKYQRCDECHGGYLIVFKCKDKKKRCARCKERYDGKEGDSQPLIGDKSRLLGINGANEHENSDDEPMECCLWGSSAC